MQDSGRIVAERETVVVAVLDDVQAAAAVVAFLDRAEAAADAPLVDEAERVRLATYVSGPDAAAAGWRRLVARDGDEVVGYAGIVLPPDPAGAAAGDVAVDRTATPTAPALEALLEGVSTVVDGEPIPPGGLELWLRRADAGDLEVAAGAGFEVERRLAVLGRDLAGVEASALPPETTLRHYLADEDDEAVVQLLAAAYVGTPEAGWDLDRLRTRRELGWFRPEDLIVAVDQAGTIVGLHWLKRRSADVGEVYNLAVAPGAQGRGLAPALLTAGLDHLAAIGCREVILWVDRANPRAVRLYESHGFRLRWEDVALGRRPGGR